MNGREGPRESKIRESLCFHGASAFSLAKSAGTDYSSGEKKRKARTTGEADAPPTEAPKENLMKKSMLVVMLAAMVLCLAVPTPGHARGWGWWGPAFVGGVVVGSALAWPYYAYPYAYPYPYAYAPLPRLRSTSSRNRNTGTTARTRKGIIRTSQAAPAGG